MHVATRQPPNLCLPPKNLTNTILAATIYDNHIVNSQPPADLWRQAINRGHRGRATQRSSDYATT